MFLFKRKKVVVDCFTTSSALIRNYPIKKSSYYMPEWWKKLDPSISIPTDIGLNMPSPTMKSCTGFVHLFRESWTIPSWSDFKIATSATGEWRFVTPSNLAPQIQNLPAITSHGSSQYGNHFDEFIHLKLTSPWLVSSKLAINFIMTGADWSLLNDLPDFRVLTGFLNFKYSTSLNINLFVPRKDIQYFLQAGTPIAYLIPLTDKKVEFITHVVDDIEYKRISLDGLGYTNKFIKGVVNLK